MSTFPGSPRLIKGALIGIDPLNPLASIVVFQYNSDTMTRRLEARAVSQEGERGEAMRLTLAGKTTAAATTGPASGPRPTSSTPMRRCPTAQRVFSWRSVGRGVAVRGMSPMLYGAWYREQGCRDLCRQSRMTSPLPAGRHAPG